MNQSLSRRNFVARLLANRLFFAGEASAVTYVQPCSGTYSSGEKAAGKVIAEFS